MVSYTVEDLKKLYENMTQNYIYCDSIKEFFEQLEFQEEDFK